MNPSLPPDDRSSELRDLFFESAEEILQGMNEAGLALEQNPTDVESLRSVRRAVHTLKGDSAACGYRALSLPQKQRRPSRGVSTNA